MVPRNEDDTKPRWGVEVELTLKSRRRYCDEVLARLHPDVGGLAYFTPPQLLAPIREAVSAALEQLPNRRPLRLRFRALPASVTPSTDQEEVSE